MSTPMDPAGGGLGHPEAEELSAYVDGNVAPADAAVIREHLLGCSHCRGQVEDLRLVRELMRGLPFVEPPLGFYERTLRLGPRPRSRAGLRLVVSLTLGVVAVVSLFVVLVVADRQPRAADQSLEAMALDLGRAGTPGGPSATPPSTVAPSTAGTSPEAAGAATGMPSTLAGYAYTGREEFAGDEYLVYRRGARRFAVTWEQAELSAAAFPEGAEPEPVPVTEGRAWYVAWNAGGLLFVQRGERAYAVVVDDAADLQAIAAALPADTSGPSAVERIEAAGRSLLEAFGLGSG